MQHAVNGFTNGKSPDLRRPNNGYSDQHNTPGHQLPTENCHLCPCHEPIQDWMSVSMTGSQDRLGPGHPDCACWNKLSMRGDQDGKLATGRKSASANPSPSSSPKKTRYNGGMNSLRSIDCDCTCDKGDVYANYAVPRSAVGTLKVSMGNRKCIDEF